VSGAQRFEYARALDLMRNSLTPLLVAAALTAALSGCSQQSRQHAADQRLSALYSSEWKWRTDQLPDDEDGTRPIADHLPKVDPATQDMRRKYWRTCCAGSRLFRARACRRRSR
jgi:hypothetical protein